MKFFYPCCAIVGFASSATSLFLDEVFLRIAALLTSSAAVATPFVVQHFTDKREERKSRERREEAGRLAILKAAEIKATQDRFEFLVKYNLINTERSAMEATDKVADVAAKARRQEELLQDLERIQREIARNTAINSSVVDPIIAHREEFGVPIPPVPSRDPGSAGSGLGEADPGPTDQK